MLQALSVLLCLAPAETRTWTRTWTRNLDKFYHVFSSYRATCPSSPGELGQGTWTTAGCRVTSSLSITPRFQAGPDSNFVAQGGNPKLGQVLSRFPLAEPLVQVRPGNLDKELGQLRAAVLQALSVLRPDSRQAPIPCASPLSLRRIRSLKRCVQACGCKIMTPRYAPQFGSRLHFKRCQPLPKETPFPFFSGTLFLGPIFFLVFS